MGWARLTSSGRTVAMCSAHRTVCRGRAGFQQSSANLAPFAQIDQSRLTPAPPDAPHTPRRGAPDFRGARGSRSAARIPHVRPLEIIFEGSHLDRPALQLERMHSSSMQRTIAQAMIQPRPMSRSFEAASTDVRTVHLEKSLPADPRAPSKTDVHVDKLVDTV